MIPYKTELFDCLHDLGLEDWSAVLDPLFDDRLADSAHGDFQLWREILESLPESRSRKSRLNKDVVTVGASVIAADEQEELRENLLGLLPWRKGPFEVCGINIDAEWRSEMKWNRFAGAIEPLDDRVVLDVGCGNGYYALRMRGAGARAVVGIDPTLIYVLQFMAIRHFLEYEPVFVVPARLQELPTEVGAFDTVFSMGVLYHQRAPLDHLQQLRGVLRSGGQLVLETIYVPGKESYACTPADRYARMKNVWLLPTIAELTTWLRRSKFRNIEVIDQTRTTTDEQRPTQWMPFESLAEALDPDDPTRTVEGWPAPRRVVVTATAP